MAKKKSPSGTINVSGMSIKDIINIDPEKVSHFNETDLRKLTSRLISASNKRLRALEKNTYGQFSPAYLYVKDEYGGRFSLKGLKTRNQVSNLFSSVSTFLQRKTSSIKGWTSVRLDIQERLGLDKEPFNTKYKAKKFWKAYRELYDATQGGIVSKKFENSQRNSERMQKMLYDRMVERKDWRKSPQSIIEDLTKETKRIYQEEQKERNKENSNFIVIDGLDEDEDL